MASDPIVTNRILLILIGSFESRPPGQSSPDDISSGHRDRGGIGAEVTTQRSETISFCLQTAGYAFTRGNMGTAQCSALLLYISLRSGSIKKPKYK